jgi:hypothetical protein
LEHEVIIQVAAGGWHCLAVTQAGKMYAWGGNEYFQCGVDAGWCPHFMLLAPPICFPLCVGCFMLCCQHGNKVLYVVLLYCVQSGGGRLMQWCVALIQ